MQITLPETLDGLRELRGKLDAAIVAFEALGIASAQPAETAQKMPPPKPRQQAAKPAPKAAAKRATPGQHDADIKDALHLAGTAGITATDIARRLQKRPGDGDELRALVQTVWGVLERFIRDDIATKNGRHYRLASEA